MQLALDKEKQLSDARATLERQITELEAQIRSDVPRTALASSASSMRDEITTLATTGAELHDSLTEWESWIKQSRDD